MATLSDTQKAFLQGKNFGVVATVGEDGFVRVRRDRVLSYNLD